LGSGLKEFLSSGPFLRAQEGTESAPEMSKIVVLWGVLATSAVTFAFQVGSFATPEENISIATLLKGGWQVAGYTSTLDGRSAFILFRHPDEIYLVQCRASYDVTRKPPVTSNCYKLQ
jgi:hypothetical protein